MKLGRSQRRSRKESDVKTMWGFVLAVLATWRVTHLLAAEDGPGDIIYRLRRRLGQSLVGQLMDCFNCLSLWVAAPAALFVTHDVAEWFVGWLAISGGACLLERAIPPAVAVPSATDLPQGEQSHVLWPEEGTTHETSNGECESVADFQTKQR